MLDEGVVLLFMVMVLLLLVGGVEREGEDEAEESCSACWTLEGVGEGLC